MGGWVGGWVDEVAGESTCLHCASRSHPHLPFINTLRTGSSSSLAWSWASRSSSVASSWYVVSLHPPTHPPHSPTHPPTSPPTQTTNKDKALTQRLFTPVNFWFVLSGVIHLWIEGSFVFFRTTSFIKPGLDYYAAGDFRYGIPMEVGWVGGWVGGLDREEREKRGLFE